MGAAVPRLVLRLRPLLFAFVLVATSTAIGCAPNPDTLTGGTMRQGGIDPDDDEEEADDASHAHAAEDMNPSAGPETNEQTGKPSQTTPSPETTPSAACAVRSPPAAPYLKAGLHPRASDALADIGFTAAQITQTIGNATASAGTHGQDGTAEGHAYTAAVDLSIRNKTEAQVATLLDQLTERGFVAYYRRPGYDGWPSDEARHVHAVWVGAPMKLTLRAQVRDWHVGKNGLASHTTYNFKTWTPCWREALWSRFLASNPTSG
jgi:hypothetical protein